MDSYKELFKHKNIAAERDEISGERLIICHECDEVLATENLGESFEPLWLYYTVAEASKHWPDVKKAFPADDDDDEEVAS